MSSGAKQVTKIGVESTPNTVATSWQTLAFKTNNIDAKANTTESNTIKDSRISSGSLVTGITVSGDIETEFGYGIQDTLLEGVAFNSWNNDVLTFGGTTRKTFSVMKGYKDINNYQLFTGVHLNSWVLSIADSGIVSSKYSLMGMGRTASENDPASNATPAPTTIPFSSLSTGDILIDGKIQDGMCLTQIELTIDNGMQVQKCLGKKESNGIGAILETLMKGSGSMTISWSKNTASYYEKQFTNTPIGLSFNLADSAGNKYILSLPKILISAPLATGDIGSVLNSQFSFTVADIAPTITRIPVKPVTTTDNANKAP